MKKNSVKKIMCFIILFVAICIVSNVNYASGDINALLQNIIRIDSVPATTDNNTNNANTNTNTNTNNNIANVNNDNTNINNNIANTNANVNNNNANTNNDNTNINNNTNNELPKTGVDDTMLWVLIAVSVVAAGYTYKKVRDYNV